MAPQGCDITTLVTAEQPIEEATQRLAERIPALQQAATTPRVSPDLEAGPLTPAAIGQIMSRHMPAQTIVSDEGATCGLQIYAETGAAEPHDWLTLTGGAIGQGLPVALGAAIACPEQKVIALQADGSAMYTIQALWTMAREDVDVTVVLLNNRSYAILNIELQRVGAGTPTPKTLSMLDLSNPNMDFQSMAASLGVTAHRATTAEEFETQFGEAMRQSGPVLIECMV